MHTSFEHNFLNNPCITRCRSGTGRRRRAHCSSMIHTVGTLHAAAPSLMTPTTPRRPEIDTRLRLHFLVFHTAPPELFAFPWSITASRAGFAENESENGGSFSKARLEVNLSLGRKYRTVAKTKGKQYFAVIWRWMNINSFIVVE